MDRVRRNRPSYRGTCRQSSPGIGGFTLTELLVTMAIMALLLGLLLPCLGMARKEARAVEMRSLFREVALAMLGYAQDHEGAFPKVTNLAEADQQVRQALEPYLKDKKLLRRLPPMGWRYRVDPTPSLNSVRLDQIRNPGRVPIGGEQFSGVPGKGKVRVIFADGHVGQMTWKELSTELLSDIVTGRTTGGVTISVQ